MCECFLIGHPFVLALDSRAPPYSHDICSIIIYCTLYFRVIFPVRKGHHFGAFFGMSTHVQNTTSKAESLVFSRACTANVHVVVLCEQ